MVFMQKEVREVVDEVDKQRKARQEIYFNWIMYGLLIKTLM